MSEHSETQLDEHPNAIPIERRIQIRRWIYECRESETANLCPPIDEIEVLLRWTVPDVTDREQTEAVPGFAQYVCVVDDCEIVTEVPVVELPIESPECPVHEHAMLLGGWRSAD